MREIALIFGCLACVGCGRRLPSSREHIHRVADATPRLQSLAELLAARHATTSAYIPSGLARPLDERNRPGHRIPAVRLSDEATPVVEAMPMEDAFVECIIGAESLDEINACREMASPEGSQSVRPTIGVDKQSWASVTQTNSIKLNFESCILEAETQDEINECLTAVEDPWTAGMHKPREVATSADTETYDEFEACILEAENDDEINQCREQMLRKAADAEEKSISDRASSPVMTMIGQSGQWQREALKDNGTQTSLLTDMVAELRRRELGPENQDIVASLNEYCEILCDLGRHVEVEPLQKDALELSRQVYGRESLKTAKAMHSYADTLRKLRRFPEAETLLGEVFLLRQKLVPDSRISEESLSNYAEIVEHDPVRKDEYQMRIDELRELRYRRLTDISTFETH